MRERVSFSPPPPNTRNADDDLMRSSRTATPPWTGVRGRFVVVAVAMLFVSLLAGGVSFSAQADDLIKVFAVAVFVCSMVALAFGMVGDSWRDR